jgi:hypothetical protein
MFSLSEARNSSSWRRRLVVASFAITAIAPFAIRSTAQADGLPNCGLGDTPSLTGGGGTGGNPVGSCSIGNHVFVDANNSGKYEAGEVGVSGATLSLFNNNVFTNRTTVTDENGGYRFGDLGPSDSYQICLDPPSGLVGSNASNDLGFGQTDTIAADPNNSEDDDDNGRVSTPSDRLCSGFVALNGPILENGRVDFGLYRPGYSIGNHVFVDANNSGVYDTDELGVKATPVSLWKDNVPTGRTTLTDANGIYGFYDLEAASSYQVCVDIPTGYRGSNGSNDLTPGQDDTTAPDPNNYLDNDDNGRLSTPAGRLCSGYVILGGNVASNGRVDFGMYVPGYSLGNHVFLDANNSGVYESNESGVANVVVHLWENNVDTGKTTRTDANGIYGFFDLGTSTSYQVCIDMPTGLSGSTGSGSLASNQADSNAPDPNNYLDNDDNGRISTPSGKICSGYVILAGGNAANGRVDFGLFVPRALPAVAPTSTTSATVPPAPTVPLAVSLVPTATAAAPTTTTTAAVSSTTTSTTAPTSTAPVVVATVSPVQVKGVQITENPTPAPAQVVEPALTGQNSNRMVHIALLLLFVGLALVIVAQVITAQVITGQVIAGRASRSRKIRAKKS